MHCWNLRGEESLYLEFTRPLFELQVELVEACRITCIDIWYLSMRKCIVTTGINCSYDKNIVHIIFFLSALRENIKQNVEI